jgi:hypothetical protein
MEGANLHGNAPHGSTLGIEARSQPNYLITFRSIHQFTHDVPALRAVSFRRLKPECRNRRPRHSARNPALGLHRVVGILFLIHRKIRFPAGLSGAHSVRFLRLRGIAKPDGDPGHSVVISEEIGLPVPKKPR